MERCDTCVLPKSNRFIAFDGPTCEICTASAGRGPHETSPAELDELMRRVKAAGRGRPFDCVVGYSGGRDSTHLLHQLVRRHGLRCIAGYYRTPYTPATTDDNVVRVTEQLGVKLVRLDIDREHHNRWARRAVMLWQREPTPVHASLACAPCKQVNREVLKLARRYKVRYLAMGSNRFEAVQLAPAVSRKTSSRPPRAAKVRDTVRLASAGLVSLARSRRLWRFIPVGLKGTLYISQDSPLLSFLYPEVSTFNYFFYAGWDEEECEASLRELGWQLPPGCSTSWRADCTFAEVKDRMFEQMVGMTYVDGFFSNRVRTGDLDRDEALRRLQVEGRPSDERLKEACDVLEVPTETFA